MFCSDCGKRIDVNVDFCPECGFKIVKKQVVSDVIHINSNELKPLTVSEQLAVKNPLPNLVKKFKTFIVNNKKQVIIVGMIVLIFIIGIITFNAVMKGIRSKDEFYKFTINKETFYIGRKSSYYVNKGYTYMDQHYDKSNLIVPDGFIPYSFYHNNLAVMLVALHCDSDKNCSYSDATVVKINFYENIGEVIFSDFIKIGTSYDDIIAKLGKEDGKFYMKNSELVWAKNKGEVGTPYYILGFQQKKVTSMKIGIWWYEGEYEHSVKE